MAELDYVDSFSVSPIGCNALGFPVYGGEGRRGPFIALLDLFDDRWCRYTAFWRPLVDHPPNVFGQSHLWLDDSSCLSYGWPFIGLQCMFPRNSCPLLLLYLFLYLSHPLNPLIFPCHTFFYLERARRRNDSATLVISQLDA